MVHGLLWVKLGDGRQDTVGVTCQEDDVLGMATNGRDLHVTDMLKGIAHTSVRGETDIVVVDDTLLALFLEVASVLNNSAKLDGIENIGLLGARETISLGIAATLDVEDVLVGPHMLVVTDKQTLGVGGKSGLTSA